MSNQFTEKAEQMVAVRRERITLIRRTHDIFCGLHGKGIKLIAGDNPGHTDTETFVSVPLEDDHADLIHKHEWQHIFMNSDLRAREKFVKEYVEEIRVGAPQIYVGPLENFLHMFVNGLDDLRVNDLWKRIYPQSAEDLENRWRHIILANRGFSDDLIIYCMAVGLGLRDHGQLPPSDWDPYLDVVKEGLTKVYGYGSLAPMVAAKFILDRIIKRVLGQFLKPVAPIPISPQPFTSPQPGGQGQSSGGPPAKRLGNPPINRRETTPAQQQAQQGMMNSQAAVLGQALYGAERSKALNFFKDAKKPEGEDPNYPKTAATVKAVMGATTHDQIQQVLNDSKLEVEKALQALLGKTRTLTADQRLLKGMEGKVFFRDFGPNDVEPYELQADDRYIIERLRNHFSHLMDKKRKRTSEEGSVLDTTAYIDFLTGNGDGEVFEEEHVQKGFTALILIDMSGSMKNEWEYVSRACKVLAKSLKFPFSHFEVWGFTGTAQGSVYMNRFLDPEKGYKIKEGEIWGTTPLHIAAEVAVRRLMQKAGTAQHLFIITDGVPMHATPKGEQRNPADLMRTVSSVVARGRKRGINTVGVVIGDAVPNGIADLMFSPGKWARVEEEEFFIGLVGLVQSAFTSYLKRR